MKITKITVTSEAVLNYQKAIYSIEVELDENDNIIECTKQAQKIANSAALASVKAMSNDLNGTTINKTIERPQYRAKSSNYETKSNYNSYQPAIKPPTPAQIQILQEHNIPIPASSKEAGNLIQKIRESRESNKFTESEYPEPDDEWYENF